jgi:hypothetical protein
MIKTEKSDLQNKGKRKTRNLAMLLLLRRPLRDAVHLCAFEMLMRG